jgi:DNA recombination protein RmuC
VDQTGLLFLAVGLALGAALGWTIARSKSLAREAHLEALLETREEGVEDHFKVLASDALRNNAEQFILTAKQALATERVEGEKILLEREKAVEGLVKPLSEKLEKLEALNQKLSLDRRGDYEGLKRQMDKLGEKTDMLGRQAGGLATALSRSSNVRGDWGEIQIENIFEMANMTEHIDYVKQKGIEGGSRPDFVVNLPGEATIPIDAKSVGKHYLEAIDSDDPKIQSELLAKHAQSMKDRVKELDSKAYQQNVPGYATHVIMFVPSEALVAAAFHADPNLFEFALRRKVLVASPIILLAILQTVRVQWQQVEIARDAEEITNVAKEFYKRLITWSSHFSSVGKRLDKAVEDYNRAVGSWASSVQPQAKRLQELNIEEALGRGLEEPSEIERGLRELSTPSEEG